MAFEPNFEKITMSYRKNIGSTQAQVEYKLPVGDEIEKILCINAKSCVSTVEHSGKDVVYSGFVSFVTMYQNKDNEIMSLDYTAEFKETYGCGVDGQFVPVVETSVVDVTAQVLNGEVKMVATVETTIDGIFDEMQNVLTNLDGGNFYAKKDLITYSTFASVARSKFEEVHDLEIKDGVSKVLTVCPSVYLDSVEVNERFLTVKGTLNVNVTYLTDNNMVRTAQAKYDVAQEVAQDDITTDSFVQSILDIAYNDIKVTTSIDTDMAIVNINLPLLYSGYVFNKNTTEIVTDLFSTTHFTNINVNSMTSLVEHAAVSFDDKISGSVTIGDSASFIDEMLGACCGNVVLANTNVTDGNLVVEGVASVTTLYLNKETNGVYSVEVEMPFMLSTPVDYPNSVIPLVSVSLSDVNVRARRGKEIEVNANIEVYSNFYDSNKDAVITAVTEEDEIPEEECALSIYLAKDGDTIWEIAKELKVSPEMISEQNPNVVEPITAGTKIVIYRQKQMEY